MPSTDSLVLYLPFNGNADDQSGNGYNGIVQGATLTSGPDNQPNTAYFFNGVNSSIVIPNLTKLDRPLKAFTILIRLRPQDVVVDTSVRQPHGPTYNFLTWHRSSSDSAMAFLRSKMRTGWLPARGGTEPGKAFLSYVMDWCSDNTEIASGYQKDTALVYNQWHTIAYVYNAGNMFVYHNCNKEVNSVGIYPLVSDLCGTDPMQITVGTVPQGAFQYGYRPFKGEIDELRVYTRALDEKEVETFAGGLCSENVFSPRISLKQDSCYPQQVQFMDVTPANTALPLARRVWKISNGDSAVADSFSYRFPAAGSYTLSLQLFTERAMFQKDTVVYVPFTGPRRFLQISDTAIGVCEGGDVQPQLSGAVAYQWQPCFYLNDCTSASPVISLEQSMRYTITATDAFSCADTASFQITVAPDNQPVYVPTAFTPNGDGLNDSFGAHSAQLLTNFQFRIFNRWGQQVFASRSQTRKWDGRVKGKLASTGVYVWTLSYKNGNGCLQKERNGTTVLIIP